MRVRAVVGALLAIVAIVLIFSPLKVGAALQRPAETSSQIINLRASWGGTLLGLSGFIAFFGELRPFRRTIVRLLFWTMLGIGSARALGFMLDGRPDALQWFWLGAEVASVISCAAALRRWRRASS